MEKWQAAMARDIAKLLADVILIERKRCADVARGMAQAYRVADSEPTRSAVADEVAKHIEAGA